MADTINVEVTPGWQQVLIATGSSKSGVISIGGGGEYCEAGSTPLDSLVGHVFTDRIVPFNIDSGQRIYVKTYRDSDVVVITED